MASVAVCPGDSSRNSSCRRSAQGVRVKSSSVATSLIVVIMDGMAAITECQLDRAFASSTPTAAVCRRQSILEQHRRRRAAVAARRCLESPSPDPLSSSTSRRRQDDCRPSSVPSCPPVTVSVRRIAVGTQSPVISVDIHDKHDVASLAIDRDCKTASFGSDFDTSSDAGS